MRVRAARAETAPVGDDEPTRTYAPGELEGVLRASSSDGAKTVEMEIPVDVLRMAVRRTVVVQGPLRDGPDVDPDVEIVG